MHEERFQEYEACLTMFGWTRGGEIEQFLANGDGAMPEIVFHNNTFNSSVFALSPLVDRRQATYADWGFYEEGSLKDFGYGPDELLAYLSKLSTVAG